jgi:hypothetical protein
LPASLATIREALTRSDHPWATWDLIVKVGKVGETTQLGGTGQPKKWGKAAAAAQGAKTSSEGEIGEVVSDGQRLHIVKENLGRRRKP